MEKQGNPILQHPYLPGLIMFVLAVIVGLFVFHDYGMCWDEPYQRAPAILSYNYIMHGSQDLFIKKSDNHGAGFEILLVFIEKLMKLNDSRDIYMMRRIVSNIFFLGSVFAAYVLIYKLFKNRFLACLGFFMLAFMPRMFAHSFYNTKDIPFVAMVIVIFAVCQAAFEKDKSWLFLMLGFACGYATSIRIMGIMFALFILLFLAADIVFKVVRKEKATKQFIHVLLFTVGFLLLLYIPWPFIWKHPIKLFLESFGKMSHYAWTGGLLFDGQIMMSDKPLPWTYFPTWFMITVPELWLLAGLVGIGWLSYDFFKRPKVYIQNTYERNFLLYLFSFFAPVISVIFLHSVIYDDWRHLYFVYPPFVFMGLYFINKFINGKYAKIVQGVCVLQAAVVILFMVQNHPFEEVYFNNLVSHEEESLRNKYDMEYWGCSFKQGLDYLVENDTSRHMHVCCEYKTMLDNNIMLLHKEDRGRFQFTMFDTADYYMSNFRLHPQDYPGTNIVYQAQVLNSTIFRVYKLKGTPNVKLR